MWTHLPSITSLSVSLSFAVSSLGLGAGVWKQWTLIINPLLPSVAFMRHSAKISILI